MKIAIYDVTTKSIDNYTPYFTPIELNKMGNYQDFIKKGTGKNLFDKNNANILNGWLDNNKMALSSTQLNRLFYIPCKANTTYTISRSILTSTFRVATYDSEPFPTIGSSEAQYDISGLIKNNSATSITITTGANAKYLIVHYGRLETDLNIEESLKTIQIEENSQATSFEPYGYKDQWYIEKNVGKVVLNGSENGGSMVDNNQRIMFSSYNIPILSNVYIANPSSVSNLTPSLCNHFLPSFQNDLKPSNTKFAFSKWADTIYIYFSAIVDNVADFKTWLSTHNTIVYYALANTTYTLIENEELIGQLNELSNANLLKGTTNILVNGSLPAYLDLTYYNNNFNGNFTVFNNKTDEIDAKTESVQNDLVNNYVQNGTFGSYTESTDNRLDDLDTFKTAADKAINGNDKLHYICDGTETGSYYFKYDNVEYYFTMPTIETGSKLLFDISDQELKLNDTVIPTSSTGTGTELKFVYDDPGLIRTVTESSAWINANGETVDIVARTYTTNMKTLGGLVTDTEQMIKNFTFGGDGLTITADRNDTTVNTEMNLNVTNEAVRIRKGSEDMMRLDSEGIHFSEVTFKEIRLGDYVFKDEENGGFGFMYDPQPTNNT